MPRIIHNPEELAGKLLKAARSAARPVIIGIDGVMGAGKTTLAYFLNDTLKFTILGLDDYFKKRGPGMRAGDLPEYDYRRLSKDIDTRLKRKNILIIEGLFLLQALEAVNRPVSIMVYLIPGKESSRYDFFRRIESRPAGLLKDLTRAGSALDEAVVRYHLKYAPARKADFLFRYGPLPVDF